MADWLVLPAGRLSLIRRLLGICAILTAWLTIQFLNVTAHPYAVPTWCVGPHCFTFPVPPMMVTKLFMVAYFVSCSALIAGCRNKIFLFAPIAALVYYGCLDISVATVYSTVLLTFLIAFLFENGNESLTRRLMQLSTAICYGCSALRKLTLFAYLSGSSLAAVAHDPMTMSFFALKVVSKLNPSHEFSLLLSWVVILVEAFLCVGLFFERTRKPALWLGFIMQGVMACLLNPIGDLYSMVMAVGLLSFVKSAPPEDLHETESNSSSPSGCFRPHKASIMAAFACLAIWLAMPLRVYCSTDPFNQVALQDYHPWSFDMFAIQRTPVNVHASIVDAEGVDHPINPHQRMCYAQCELEIYALADYIRRLYPEARQIKVDALLSINSQWWQKKTLNVQTDSGKCALRTESLTAVNEDQLKGPASCECHCHMRKQPDSKKS